MELRAARAELALARSGQLRALAQAKLQLAGDQGSGEPGAADTKGEAWREAPPGPSEAVSRELEAAKGQAEALQEELTESQRSLAELEESLKRRCTSAASRVHPGRISVVGGAHAERRGGGVAARLASTDGEAFDLEL